MKKCLKCGIIFDDPDVRYCGKCGAVLVDSSVEVKKGKNALTTCLIILAIGFASMMILAILAAIAIPNFLMFQAKSKQSEARTILTGIYEAEMAYFAVNNTFSSNPDKIGFKPPSSPHYYKWKIISADSSGFKARAWGNIDRDKKIDIWEVTEKQREPVNVYNDVSDSGDEIDPQSP